MVREFLGLVFAVGLDGMTTQSLMTWRFTFKRAFKRVLMGAKREGRVTDPQGQGNDVSGRGHWGKLKAKGCQQHRCVPPQFLDL